jgi:hypothetical protein
MPNVDLDAIWVCINCQKCLAFETDMLEHKQNRGHTQFSMIDLDSYNGKIVSQGQSDLDWQIQNK